MLFQFDSWTWENDLCRNAGHELLRVCDVVYKYLRYKLTDIIFVEMVLIMKTGELSVLSDASRAFFFSSFSN